jgi:anti-sigma factor RsiW
MSGRDVHQQLGAYVLNILDPDERRAVDEHLKTCEESQRELLELTEAHSLLALLPTEMAVPQNEPADDLVLQRTLRRARTERASRRGLRLSGIAAGVAVLVAVGVGVGTMVGGQPNRGAVVAGATETAASATPTGRTVSASDATTKATLTATVIPAVGWARLEAQVSGVAQGEKCRLLAISRSGEEEIAGSWVVSEKAATTASGSKVFGSVLLPAKDISELRVVTVGGDRLVSVKL